MQMWTYQGLGEENKRRGGEYVVACSNKKHNRSTYIGDHVFVGKGSDKQEARGFTEKNVFRHSKSLFRNGRSILQKLVGLHVGILYCLSASNVSIRSCS